MSSVGDYNKIAGTMILAKWKLVLTKLSAMYFQINPVSTTWLKCDFITPISLSSQFFWKQTSIETSSHSKHVIKIIKVQKKHTTVVKQY